LALALREVTFMLLRWSLLGGGSGGEGGDDNVLESTFLMSHLNEVTFMLLRCALFVVHELVLWLLRSLWFMHMK
jgi:hypothetical protein